MPDKPLGNAPSKVWALLPDLLAARHVGATLVAHHFPCLVVPRSVLQGSGIGNMYIPLAGTEVSFAPESNLTVDVSPKAKSNASLLWVPQLAEIEESVEPPTLKHHRVHPACVGGQPPKVVLARIVLNTGHFCAANLPTEGEDLLQIEGRPTIEKRQYARNARLILNDVNSAVVTISPLTGGPTTTIKLNAPTELHLGNMDGETLQCLLDGKPLSKAKDPDDLDFVGHFLVSKNLGGIRANTKLPYPRAPLGVGSGYKCRQAFMEP